MSQTGPSLDDLIRAYRQGAGMTEAQRSANRARLLSRVLAAAAISPVATATAATGTASWVIKVALGVALATGAGAAYVATRPTSTRAPVVGHSRPGPVPVLSSSAPAVPTPPAPSVRPTDASGPITPRLAKPRRARRASSSTTVASTSLAVEVQLMHAVDAALKAGRPEHALALLGQRRDGDGGLMGEERAAARVVSLCQLGRVESARAEAVRFLRDRPRSPLAARIRAACAPPGEIAAPGQVK